MKKINSSANSNSLRKTAFTFFILTIIQKLIFAPLAQIAASNVGTRPAKGEIVAKINFDPKVNGFGFENYGNDRRNRQDDLTAENMIRLFGARGRFARSGDAAIQKRRRH